MSHTTTLKALVIRDTKALFAAVKALQEKGVNCSLVEDTKPRMYYNNQHGKCAYVLKLHDAQYDVGFDLQKDGTYVPVLDDWGNHVRRAIGASEQFCPLADQKTPQGRAQHAIGQFMQQYGLHAAMNAAMDQGYTVAGHSFDNNGNVQLELVVSY